MILLKLFTRKAVPNPEMLLIYFFPKNTDINEPYIFGFIEKIKQTSAELFTMFENIEKNVFNSLKGLLEFG